MLEFPVLLLISEDLPAGLLKTKYLPVQKNTRDKTTEQAERAHMLSETQKDLDSFFANLKLTELLWDDRFLWENEKKIIML